LIIEIVNSGYVSNLKGHNNNADKSEKCHENNAKLICEKNGYKAITLLDFLKIEHAEHVFEGYRRKTKNKEEIDRLKKIYKCEIKKQLKNFSGQKFYIYQPFGSQKSPDFIIIDDNKIIYVELKSGKKDKMLINSGIPLENQIIIFSCPEGSICMLGQHYMSLEIKLRIKEAEDKCDLIYCELNEALSKLYNPYVIAYYPRRMINHTKSIINNEKTENNQKEVFEYLESLKLC
jgi:hypothetical protein